MHAQGLSQREIAKHTGIPRTTVQRILQSPRLPEVVPSPPDAIPPSSPEVYTGVPLPEELIAARGDLWEMIEWWRARKTSLQIGQGGPRETQRYTFHIETRYIDLIKQHADVERISYSAVVNTALQRFFEET